MTLTIGKKILLGGGLLMGLSAGLAWFELSQLAQVREASEKVVERDMRVFRLVDGIQASRQRMRVLWERTVAAFLARKAGLPGRDPAEAFQQWRQDSEQRGRLLRELEAFTAEAEKEAASPQQAERWRRVRQDCRDAQEAFQALSVEIEMQYGLLERSRWGERASRESVLDRLREGFDAQIDSVVALTEETKGQWVVEIAAAHGRARFSTLVALGITLVLGVVASLAVHRSIRRQQAAMSLEQELREQQQAYTRDLIESNSEALAVTDTTGVITDVNRQMCVLTGCAREELIGSPGRNLITDPHRADLGLGQALAAGQLTDFEVTLRAKDGREKLICCSATVLKDADGRARGVISTVRDVTEQKHLQQQLTERNRELTETTAFLNNVLESSTEYSIIATDMDGNILSWNEGARRNYGYTAAEAVGRMNWRDLHAAEEISSGRARAALDAVTRKWKAEGEFWRLRKDGSRFQAAVSITARRDLRGALIGLLLISKDITRQKALEDELRRKNEEIREQFGKAEEANRLKSEFLANMSHELRTPLNAIIGFTELLHDGKVGAVSDRQKEFLGDVLTSSQHLLQLINDVLDLSKIEAGKMEFRPEPADMAKLAGEVRDILRTLAAGKRIRVETDVTRLLGDVVIDPARFKQVLYNFVSNALKFTPDEGRVAIRVKPEGAEKFRLEVEDTGIGVRPEDLSKLFSEFRQLDAGMAKKHGGTGLGLALTKRIVEAQGGRVGVESTPGKGSLFYAVLPRAAKAERQEETPPALMTPRAGAASVLVIDDDSKDRAWLLETLSKAGYAVEPAPSGFEALALCRQRKFDAITLDLLLPDMSGWDVLRAIRKEETNRDTPVIVVTVVAEKGVGIGFPIHDVLVKPVDAADLLASIGGAGVLPDGTHKVLAVDDNPRDLRLLGEVLRQLGYRPICQPDGESALAAAAAERPSAIVLDLVMPGVDGFEFLRRLRQTADGRRTPVIVWTSKDLTAEERAGLRAAAQAVVAKGNGTSALLEELRTWAPVPS